MDTKSNQRITQSLHDPGIIEEIIMNIPTIKDFLDKFCTSPSIKYVFGIDGIWSYHLDDCFIEVHGDDRLLDIECDWSYVYAEYPNRQMRITFITMEDRSS